jgi:hypothetical protein
MARRKRHSEEELPFVALMDTMTNVVGVLIIVLVMIGISLANAVKKVISDLPPATPAQVQAAQQAVDKLKSSIAFENTRIRQLLESQVSAETLAALKREIERLMRELDQRGVKLVDLEPLRKQIAEMEAKQKATLSERQDISKQIESLKAELAAVPEAKPVIPKVVRLPQSRDIPKDAVKEVFFINKDGVVYADGDAAKAIVLREIQMNSRMLEKPRTGSVKPGSPPVYDRSKLENYFQQKSLQTPYLSLKPSFLKLNLGWVQVSGIPGRSESIQQIVMPNSVYQTALRKIRMGSSLQKPKVAIFYVEPEGFENYLAAREICDRSMIPAGWKLPPFNSVGFSLTEIKLDGVPIPQATPAKVPTKPADPNQIKKPSLKLD